MRSTNRARGRPPRRSASRPLAHTLPARAGRGPSHRSVCGTLCGGCARAQTCRLASCRAVRDDDADSRGAGARLGGRGGAHRFGFVLLEERRLVEAEMVVDSPLSSEICCREHSAQARGAHVSQVMSHDVRQCGEGADGAGALHVRTRPRRGHEHDDSCDFISMSTAHRASAALESTARATQ